LAIKETLSRGRDKQSTKLRQILKMTGMTALPSHCVSDGRYQFVWLLETSRIGAACLFTVFALLPPLVGNSWRRNAFAVVYGDKKTVSVSFQTIEKGQRSGISDPSHVVARNSAEWKALWEKHNAFLSERAQAPTIHFDREIVIGVFLGNRTTGGYEVEIVNITQIDRMMTVFFTEKTPPKNGMVIQSLTQPFHLVRLSAKGDQQIRFRRVP
jgi:hypothetical protein